jgi:hypothetical protein
MAGVLWLGVLTMVHPGLVLAWGPDGHHTVAAIADKLLVGTNATNQVHAILGNVSLTDAAV